MERRVPHIPHKNVLVGVFVFLFIGLIIMSVYFQTMPKQLYPSEVTEYQGENLSSINDFVENSIAGHNTSTLNISPKCHWTCKQTLELTYDQVLQSFQNYQKVVTLHCVEGWSVKILWEGFLVKDLLNQAGVDPNASTVIFYASDGYSTALTHWITLQDNNILIAYKMNDVTLPPERGFPFQLVAESQLVTNGLNG